MFNKGYMPILFSQGKKRWNSISLPSSDFSWLPFSIQQDGDTFRPDPAFDLQTYTSQYIPAGTTYYVSMTGNDSNTGLSWAQAFRSVFTATAKVDAALVYVDAGYYYRRFCAGMNPARNMAIIGVGNVYLTSDEYWETGAWAASGSHYNATNTRTLSKCYDSTNPDAFGDWGLMTLAANEAACDATPNSWFKSGAGAISVRTWDGRVPDSNIRMIPTTVPYTMNGAQNKVAYINNIHFMGGNAPAILTAHATPGVCRFYAENCEFGYSVSTTANCLAISGFTETMLFNCSVHGSLFADGLNYKIGGLAVAGYSVEYNVHSYSHGDSSADQPSTTHDGIKLVRIMGEYEACAATTILADVGGAVPNVGRIWNLGCEVHHPTNPATAGAGYVDAGVQAWYDRCYFHDLGANAKGFVVADAGSAIRHKNMRYDAVYANTNNGTFSTY